MANPIPQEITLEMMRESLFTAVVCDALDSLGYRRQSPRVQFPIQTVEGVLVGRCKTTLWGEMAHHDTRPYDKELEAVDGCQAGNVLIGAAHGSARSGLWGEILSTAARNSGCVGAVIDGAVRDVRRMQQMQFPVFARSTSPYDSRDRQRVVDIDVTVEIDGVSFQPGDLVFADIDGMVVVPQEVEGETIERAWQKVHDEDETRQAISNGMRATDAFAKYGVL